MNASPNVLTTKFSYEGSTVSVHRFNEATSSDTLKPQVYALGKSQFGFFLTVKASTFDLQDKPIFGNLELRAGKVINTYQDRKTSTGILATGDKGSGKTMLTKLICNQAVTSLNLPVIQIEFAATGPGFLDFIESLGECVLLFDEFGKTYRQDEDSQDALLSLLDGTGLSKRLILMTENNETAINDFLLGRPGRLFYHFRYGKLDIETITDVCKAANLDEEKIKTLLDISRAARIFSFDILEAIIEEHQRYNEPIADTIKDLNLGLGSNLEVRMEVLKVIHIQTNEEVEVTLATKFFNKPDRYTNAYISINHPSLKLASKNSKVITTARNLDDEDDYDIPITNSKGTIGLAIRENNLKVEETTTCVYIANNNQYAVTARYVETDDKSYIKYL